MHAMKCNLSNYLKISYCYFGDMHYLDKFKILQKTGCYRLASWPPT
jgi:hypothetical protein